MKKIVNNLTDTPVTLGGVKVGAKGQRMVRESLVTGDEQKAIKESDFILTITVNKITVDSVSAVERAKLEEEAEAEAKAKEEANVTAQFEDFAYPVELIKNDGTLNGKPALKSKIDALKEQYGETILDDKSFTEKYPDSNIDAHRVEVGE